VNDTASLERMALEQDERITGVLKREQARRRNFIRRRVRGTQFRIDVVREPGQDGFVTAAAAVFGIGLHQKRCFSAAARS
jgi:hypothetical protein